MNATLASVGGDPSSALGFGCSALLGPNSRQRALRLLEAAYEAGITHFDVARSYGSGEAESVLGTFLRGRRESVTVTSKFGIVAAGGIVRRGPALRLARRLMRLSPHLRRALGRGGAVLVKRGAFSAEDARGSLDTTLRALGTDYLDVYLLHDCAPDDCSEELVGYLRECIQAGKVKRLGVGTDPRSAAAIVRMAPELGGVVQVRHNAAEQNASLIPNGEGRLLITHGAVAPLSRVSEHLRHMPKERDRWAQELDADLSDGRALASLLLSYALDTNRHGLVLFSSTEPRHIADNAAIARGQSFTPAQLERFGELVRTALSPGSGAS